MAPELAAVINLLRDAVASKYQGRIVTPDEIAAEVSAYFQNLLGSGDIWHFTAADDRAWSVTVRPGEAPATVVVEISS